MEKKNYILNSNEKTQIYMEKMQQEKQQYLMLLNGYFLIKIVAIGKILI